MRNLITKIRQKMCCHRRISGGGWVHEGIIQSWTIIGICDRCGCKVFELSLSDKSIENMYKDMQKEKLGEER